MEKARVNVLVWFLAGCACCTIGKAPLRLLHKTAHPPSSVEGILQIYHNGQWGTVCDDAWDMFDTKVACKQLGYENAVAIKFLGQGPDPIWLENVHCIGNESSLDQCTHSGWGSHDCGHDEDVGIVCTGSLRLLRKTFSPSLVQGILQIYHNGQWGTICDDSWRMSETKVACKELGYESAVSFKHLGQGPDPIWLDEVDCSGNESLLEQCHHRGWGSPDCSHSDDVGIVCNTGIAPLRLLHKTFSSTSVQGLLQIYYNGQWGTICDDDWDMTNTNIACKQLGYKNSSTFQHLGQGTDPIWLDNVNCNGNETSLNQCHHQGWGFHNCKHGEDVGIVCNSKGTAPIRMLRKSFFPSTVQGILQIKYNGQWGTICDDTWNISETKVACAQLGYESAVAFKHLGQGPDPIWLDEVTCNGNESSLEQCYHRGWGSYNCSHSKDVGIACNTGRRLPLRLSSIATSPSLAQGNLQIFYNGQWGTICKNAWNMTNTDVACKQLGYESAVDFKTLIGQQLMWLDNVKCNGNESSIDQCRHQGWGYHNCGHDESVGIVCYAGPPVKARLIGDVANAGRVQLLHKGIWKNLCNTNWGVPAANVICKMAGYPDGSVVKFYRYSDSGEVWLSSYRCYGYEQSIESCRDLNWGQAGCSNKNLAGVVCKSGSPNVTFRLVNGTVRHAGQLEMRYYGSWKPLFLSTYYALPVLGLKDVHVICRMIGFNQAITFNQLQTNVIHYKARIRCRGFENTTEQCLNFNVHDYGNWVRATTWIVCKPHAGSRFTVRLMDGNSLNNGRVEIGYSGIWGTVSDLYSRWDLTDATVVCRMLGYRNASWTGRARVLGNGFIMRVHKNCEGSETSLENCKYYTTRNSFDNHFYDVGLRCSSEQDHKKLQLSLVENGAKSLSSGRVSIRYGNSWGILCYEGLDYSDVKVICRMLGYVNVYHVYAIWTPSSTDDRVWLSNIECNGTEPSILNCTRKGWWQTTCDYDAVVQCKTGKTAVDIRLESGTANHSGRVGINYDNIWGTLCNKELDMNDARVICRMLGYDGVGHIFTIPGNGTIWLSDLKCNGAEDSIVHCRHSGWWQTSNCSHDQDTAVTCKTADAPNFQIDANRGITDRTVIVKLSKTTESFDARLKSSYQFVIEKTTEVQSPITSYSNASFQKCFNTTRNVFSDSYITAELPLSTNGDSSFTIGDGFFHHGYHNAPLEPGCMYRLHVRIVTIAMNGKKVFGKSSFARFTTKAMLDISAHPPKFLIRSSSSIYQTSVVITFLGEKNKPKQNRWYQVAVERADKDLEIFKSQDVGMNLSSIVAMIPTSMSHFTIGDGSHGYNNAPLEPGCTYKVYARVVALASNKTRVISDTTFVSFTTKSGRVHAEAQGPSSKNYAAIDPLLMIGLFVAMGIAILALIGCIVYIVMAKKRKKKGKDNINPQIEISELASAWVNGGETSNDQQYQELILPRQHGKKNALRSTGHSPQDIYQSLSPQTRLQHNRGFDEEQPSRAYHISDVARTERSNLYQIEEPIYDNVNV